MYGGKAITPNFDRFAELPGTVVFDRAYVQQAICCPTRSSFLTGRRPDTTKVWDLKTQFRVSGGANWTTLPQFFRERGYWTAGMGKVRQQQLLPSIALLAHSNMHCTMMDQSDACAQACPYALCRASIKHARKSPRSHRLSSQIITMHARAMHSVAHGSHLVTHK